MAQNNYLWAFVLGALLIGGFTGALWFSNETVKEVPVEVTKEVQVMVPYNVTVTETVASADGFLKQAELDIFAELGDEDDFLGCNGYEYDENEVSISDVRSFGYVWTDEQDHATDYVLTYEAKFKFKTEDERACTEVRTYQLTYEEGEDVEVVLL